MKRIWLIVALASVALAPVTANAQGDTPFDVKARLTCRNTVRWSVTVGDQPTQVIGVSLDFNKQTASVPAPTAGTYTGTFSHVRHTVAHTVIFRRFSEAKLQEQETIRLAPRVCA
jgi:hypothetical protein